MTIRRTIVSLLLAPFGALAVAVAALAWDHGDMTMKMALMVLGLLLAAGWAAGLVILLPLMIHWPQLRQPTTLNAIASAALIALLPNIYTWMQSGLWDKWQALVFTVIAGAVSGALYSIVARR